MNLPTFNEFTKSKSEAFSQVLRACSELLEHPEAKDVKEYAESRISPDNLKKFNFGWFPNNKNIHLLTEKVSKDLLFKLKLVFPYYDQSSGYQISALTGLLIDHNLVMSYQDLYGKHLGLVGRTIQDNNPNVCKYKNTFFDKSLNLFGLYQAKEHIYKNDYVIIVEGQIDCLTCHDFGIYNVVALGGTSFSRYQFNLLRRYTKNIYLLLDNDDAGIRAAKKIISRHKNEATIKALALPEEKDVDIFLRKNPLTQFFKKENLDRS